MTFAELKAELFARGTDYLEEDASGVARAERWLNQAYREILNSQPWSFLRATATGVEGDGTVNIPDLRKILFVTDATGIDTDTLTGLPGRSLQRISLEDLVNGDNDMAALGEPTYYFVLGTQVSGYPDGGQIRVSYLKRPALLSAPEDEPIFDEEYHDLIVDRAMIKAYKDSDNFEAAAALREELNQGLVAMAEDYLQVSRDLQFMDPNGSDQ